MIEPSKISIFKLFASLIHLISDDLDETLGQGLVYFSPLSDGSFPSSIVDLELAFSIQILNL